MIQVKKLYKCQKAVKIQKERAKRSTHDISFGVNKEDTFAAMRDLTPSAFSVYLYCASNQEGYAFGLSKQDVIAVTGIGERSYTSAVQVLIEKGYLIYSGETATDGKETAPLYIFHATKPDAKIA